MEDTVVSRFARKAGMTQWKKSEKPLGAINSVQILICLGEFSSIFFAAKVFKDLISRAGSYVIIITWPGLQDLFEVDEVLTLDQSMPLRTFYSSADGLVNRNGNLDLILRTAHEYFVNVDRLENILPYKQVVDVQTLQKSNIVLDKYKFLNSANSVLTQTPAKKRVVFYPVDVSKTVVSQKQVPIVFDTRSYLQIFKELSSLGFQIICIQNIWTINLKDKPLEADVNFIHENNMSRIMMYLRAYGCFFDFFGDNLALGNCATVPTFSVTERINYAVKKRDFENFILDFIGANNIMFSFLDAIYVSNELNSIFIRSIIDRFIEFYEYVASLHNSSVANQKEVDFSVYIKKLNSMKNGKFISRMLLKKESEKHEKS